MQASPLLLLFIASAILNLSLAIYGWRHRHLPGAIAFSLAMFLFTVLPLSQAVNIASSDLAIKVIALKSRVEMAGVGAIAWLVMVMQFSGYSHLVSRRLLTALSIVPLAILILNWTENPLFRSGYYIDLSGSSPALHWTNGPIFWIGLAYLNALLLTPLYLLWRSYGHISPLSFRQTLALGVSTVLPLIVNILSQVGFPPVQGINFPFAAGPVMGLIVAWAILRYHIFDLVPIARGLLIESMNDGILVLDTHNRIVDINPAMQQLIGSTVIGQSAESAFAAWPDLIARFRAVTEARTEIAIEETPPQYFDLRISSLFDGRGKLTGRVIVVRDITRHKQTENALRTSENNFRRILESAPDAILIVDQTGNITLANAQCEKIFGYPKAELLGQPVEILLPERLHEIHKIHRADYYHDPQMRPMGAGAKWELTALHRDGSEFPVEISLSPLDTETGLLTMAAIRDISERKQMESQLHLQAAALNAAANAIAITNSQGLIQWINPAFTQLTGYSFVESIGQPMQLIRSGKHSTAFYENLRKTIERGVVWEDEIINRHKNGSEYIEHQTITPVRDVRGEIGHFVAIKQDVTARRRAEEALHEAELKYRTLVEQMPAVVYIDDLDETSTNAYISPQIEMLLGYPFANWEQDPFFWKKCVHPEDYERAVAVTPNTLTRGRITEEYRMIAQDGRVIWVRDHSILVRAATGQPQFVQGFWEDVTERKYAEAELQTALKRTEVLYDVVSSAISSESLSTLLQKIVQQVAEGLPADRVSLVTFDQLSQKIKKFVRGGPGADQIQLSVSYDELMEGLSGWTIHTGQTALSSKNTPDSRESEMVQKRRIETNCGSILATPLRYHNDILGTLIAINLPEEPDFTDKDAEFLEAVASQISSAINKISLEEDLHRQNNYLTTLHDVTLGLINYHDPNSVLEAMLSHVTELMNTHHAFVDIVDPVENMLTNKIAVGNFIPQLGFRTARGEGLTGRVWESGEPIVIPDYSKWGDNLPEYHWLKTVAGFPLKVAGVVIGVIGVSFDEPDRVFTSGEIDLLRRFASLAAVILDHAGLYASAQHEIEERKQAEKALRRQNDYLEILHQISLDLLNRRDVDELLEAIIDNATRLIDAPYCDLDIVEGDVMVTRAYTSNQAFEKGMRMRRGEGSVASWQSYDTQQPVIIDDYSQWPQRNLIFDHLPIHATVIMPLISGDHCLGVFSLSRSEMGHTFTPDEIRLASLFAQQASLVLDNAQLHVEAIRQSQELRLLHEVRSAIARELDLTSIVKQTVEAIAKTFGYTLVSLYLLEGNTLVLQHQVGYDQVISEIPITMGISGRVVRTGEPVLVEDVRSDPAFLGAIEGIVSELIVPIFDEDRVAGILSVESRYGVKLTEADLRLMTALSDQISVAIGRARLYENLRHNNEHLSTLHKITLDLLKERNMEDLLQAIVDQGSKLLSTDISYLALKEGDMLVDHAVSPIDLPYQKTALKRGEDQSPVWQVFDSREPFITTDYASLPNIRPQAVDLGIKAGILLPLLTTETCKGVLGMGRTQPDHPFNEEDTQLGGLFARVAGLTIDNAQLHEMLRQESIRDPLTGLYNRRFMEEALSKELKRADRSARPLAVVMLDLDHFKRINDTFGHDVGDEVLRQLSALLKSRIRGSDIACRYGGEEFTLILPDAFLIDALQRMEQLRKDIKLLEIQHQGKTITHLTGSFGIAIFPEHGSTGTSLLKATDQALYRAKQAGRDCVVTA